MAGIQLPNGIDVVNPSPADFKYGPYANTAAAIAAVPLALRYDGLTVQITGAGNYWWIAADLSDTGLIPKSTQGLQLINTTYAALQTLKSTNAMVPSAYYNIADRGILAFSQDASTLKTLAGRSMLCASHIVLGSPNPPIGTQGRIWCPHYGFTYAINDKVVWGGKVWTNLTGAVGTAVNDLTLDATNWALVPVVAGTDYVRAYFDVTYDFDNDLIITQEDGYGNMVGPITLTDVANLGYNPCDVTDWLAFNYTYTVTQNVFPLGFFNNYSQIDLGTKIFDNKNITFIGNAFTPSTTDSNVSNNIGTNNPKTINYNVGVNYILSNNVSDFSSNTYTSPSTGLFYVQGCNFGLFNTIIGNTDMGIIDSNIGELYVSGCTNISNISGNESLSLSSVQNLAGISATKSVTINSLTYANDTITQVKNLGLPVTLLNTLAIKNVTIDASNTIFQYLEFTAPFTVNVQKFLPGIFLPNCRLVEMYLSASGLTTTGTNPSIEFGVETDAVAYMPAVLNSTLNTTPQLINTITPILTNGKRYYVLPTATTTSGSIAKIRVWVKLLKY